MTTQLYLDVDCSDITYESKPSQTVLNAVEKAKKELIGVDENGPVLNVTGRTETANESLSNSLLTMVRHNVKVDDYDDDDDDAS